MDEGGHASPPLVQGPARRQARRAGGARARAGASAAGARSGKVRRTNVDKVLFPATGFTKGELIAYYERIGEVILPHVHGRLVSVKRYPNGVEGKKWWERDHRIDDLPTLLEFANKAAIELHPQLAVADAPERPTTLVFDLDPGPPAGIRECCTVALALRGMLSQLGIETFVKTSGGKGLQVYAPLNTDVTFDETKPFAKAVAETMEQGMPELVISRQAKTLREGKVLVDWGQNDRSKSMVSAYSLRGKERPTVSSAARMGGVGRAGRALGSSGATRSSASSATAICSRRCSRSGRSCPRASTRARSSRSCRFSPASSWSRASWWLTAWSWSRRCRCPWFPLRRPRCRGRRRHSRRRRRPRPPQDQAHHDHRNPTLLRHPRSSS